MADNILGLLENGPLKSTFKLKILIIIDLTLIAKLINDSKNIEVIFLILCFFISFFIVFSFSS